MISQKPIPLQPVLKNKERNFKRSWIVPIFTPNLPASAHLVSLQITQLSHLWLWFSVLQIKVTPFISERKKCPCTIPSHMVKHPQTKQNKHTNLIYRFPSANFTIVLIVIFKRMTTCSGWTKEGVIHLFSLQSRRTANVPEVLHLHGFMIH